MAGRPPTPVPFDADTEWVPIPEPQHEDYYEPDCWGLTYASVTRGVAKPLPLKSLKRKQGRDVASDAQSPPVTAPPTMPARSKPELTAASALTQLSSPRHLSSYAFRVFTYNDVKTICTTMMRDLKTRSKITLDKDSNYVDEMVAKAMSPETEDEEEDTEEEEIPFV